MADKAAAPKKAAPRKAAAAKKAAEAESAAAAETPATSDVFTRADVAEVPPDKPDKIVKLEGPGGTRVTAPARLVDKLKSRGFKTR